MHLDSPATSSLRFLTPVGDPLVQPQDWQPALIEVLTPPDAWRDVRIQCQGKPLRPFVQVLNGSERVLATWPRSGPGSYLLELSVGTTIALPLVITIKPAKISDAAYQQLMLDLETRLPAALAIALQRVGGLAGLKLLPPQLSTRAQELQRLRRAILGHDQRPGLVKTLQDLALDPHRVLQRYEHWVDTDLARRPVGSRLLLAISRGQNLGETGIPTHVLDAAVESTYDVYENRLVRAFHDVVARRLARIVRVLATEAFVSPGIQASTVTQRPALEEARVLQKQLRRAREAATFLDEVNALNHPPERVSMVLLNRPPYRAALEGYFEFLRTVWIRLDEPALDSPLVNFPYLYEVWGTLQVFAVLLELAANRGYVLVGEQTLAEPDAEGVYMRLMQSPGQPVLTLRHPTEGTRVRLIPQRSYGASGAVRSISFRQIPDVTVEVLPTDGPPRLYLFDPKYKLDSQQADDTLVEPVKEDIDKMHAYRDSLRGQNDERVVRYAAIMYPGPTREYGVGGASVGEIAALPADPEHPDVLIDGLRAVLSNALSLL